MIDQHFLAHGHVESIADELIDQVPGQVGVASDRLRHRNAPAFVLVAILVAAPTAKVGNLSRKKFSPWSL